MQELRKRIKEKMELRDKLNEELQKDMYEYAQTPGPYIYVTEHAIIRYMERVKGFKFKSDNDIDKIKELPYPPERIRTEMMSLGEQREAVIKRTRFWRKNGFIYVINALTLVTVLEDKKCQENSI